MASVLLLPQSKHGRCIGLVVQIDVMVFVCGGWRELSSLASWWAFVKSKGVVQLTVVVTVPGIAPVSKALVRRRIGAKAKRMTRRSIKMYCQRTKHACIGRSFNMQCLWTVDFAKNRQGERRRGMV